MKRFFQFRLRTLFVLVALVGAFIVCWQRLSIEIVRRPFMGELRIRLDWEREESGAPAPFSESELFELSWFPAPAPPISPTDMHAAGTLHSFYLTILGWRAIRYQGPVQPFDDFGGSGDGGNTWSQDSLPLEPVTAEPPPPEANLLNSAPRILVRDEA